MTTQESGHEATVVVPVECEGVRIHVLARPETAVDGEEANISTRRPSLDQVMSGLAEVARTLGNQIRHSEASKVTMEFGCDMALESGALIAAIGKASAKSAFKVTLEWEKP
ncbi:CU044_2847 family protein [Streptomyces physcomitrii]|uniref:CU044_2847 family protein n=1 Tax=Streptomyces physcomitrii TaxID=2724184 RepID=UPI0033BFB877